MYQPFLTLYVSVSFFRKIVSSKAYKDLLSQFFCTSYKAILKIVFYGHLYPMMNRRDTYQVTKNLSSTNRVLFRCLHAVKVSNLHQKVPIIWSCDKEHEVMKIKFYPKVYPKPNKIVWDLLMEIRNFSYFN